MEGEAQAGYIAELVVQVYNIHEVVIEESGGIARFLAASGLAVGGTTQALRDATAKD